MRWTPICKFQTCKSNWLHCNLTRGTRLMGVEYQCMRVFENLVSFSVTLPIMHHYLIILRIESATWHNVKRFMRYEYVCKALYFSGKKKCDRRICSHFKMSPHPSMTTLNSVNHSAEWSRQQLCNVAKAQKLQNKTAEKKKKSPERRKIKTAVIQQTKMRVG